MKICIRKVKRKKKKTRKIIPHLSLPKMAFGVFAKFGFVVYIGRQMLSRVFANTRRIRNKRNYINAGLIKEIRWENYHARQTYQPGGVVDLR